MFAKLIGWLPDADDTTPGVLVDVDNLVPTLRGYAGGPSTLSLGIDALEADCRGAAAVTKLDGTVTTYAGTQTTLWKEGLTAWTEVTRSGSDYTGSTISFWNFTQFGDVIIATNKVDEPQYFLEGTSTTFEDIAAMPKCLVAEAVGNFVMIANYNDGNDYVDGWGCSAIGDYTDWTADIHTQCTYGRVYDTPGPLTALKRLRDYAIYYKRRGMYVARYVGTPTIWEFSLVSDTVGCISQQALTRVGDKHFFLSDDNFYMFDTVTITPIGDGIREWFNKECDNQFRGKTEAAHDQNRGLIYWYYPSGTSQTLDSWVAYNYNTGKWGKGRRDIEAAVQYVTPALSYNDVDSRYPTYDSIPVASYDELQPSSMTRLPAVFTTSHELVTLSGPCESCNLTTNDIGVDARYTLLTRVTPRYMKTASGEMTNYYHDAPGDDLIEDATVSGTHRFDVMRSALWHRVKLTWSGDVEITGADIQMQEDGE